MDARGRDGGGPPVRRQILTSEASLGGLSRAKVYHVNRDCEGRVPRDALRHGEVGHGACSDDQRAHVPHAFLGTRTYARKNDRIREALHTRDGGYLHGHRHGVERDGAREGVQDDGLHEAWSCSGARRILSVQQRSDGVTKGNAAGDRHHRG